MGTYRDCDFDEPRHTHQRTVTGSRHELMAKNDVTARTFRDPRNPNLTGLMGEVSDMMYTLRHRSVQ